jgi:hypothetical protein
MTNLSLTYSTWWVFICLLSGGGYAWLQYTKTAPWSNQLNYGLAFLRTILVAIICFLLIELYIQSITNYFQRPLMVIAVDDSESIRLNASEEEINDLRVGITEVEDALVDQGFDVNILDLEGNAIENIDSISFNNSTTDLSKQLNQVKRDYGDFNLSGVVFVSDGIFNDGYSPVVIPANFPIYTVGVGDTSTVKDLAIKDVRHNSTVFEGNSLLLEVQVLNTGIGNVLTEISVSQKGKVVSKQPIQLSSTRTLEKSIISIPIFGSGKQSLAINLKAVDGEFTVLNNRRTIYFDVIDAQKRVLILAAAPHPDIKAIKSSIGQSEYYSVDLNYKLPAELDYDLIIAHQYPTVRTSASEKQLFVASKIPKFMVLGAANDIRFLRNKLALLSLSNAPRKSNAVRPVLNADFEKFQLSDSFLEWVSDLPPISVPYGLAINNLAADVFLYQQIGNVVTPQPLLLFTTLKGQRLGVLFGTNSWKWKLDEFRNKQSHTNFNDLISKTVQYLSSNANKKRFYVNPQKDFYEKGEDVLFNTEEYNALFERVVGEKVTLNLTNEKGDKSSHSFVPLSENSVYKLSGLQEGVYNYVASADIDTKKYYSSGQFVVKQLNIEALNPVADFDLLRKVAERSQASFYKLDQIDEFKIFIDSLNPVSTIHTTEKEEPIINLAWVLIFLLMLATSEWFLRKFYGGY